jgi:hypothetical protein
MNISAIATQQQRQEAAFFAFVGRAWVKLLIYRTISAKTIIILFVQKREIFYASW